MANRRKGLAAVGEPISFMENSLKKRIFSAKILAFSGLRWYNASRTLLERFIFAYKNMQKVVQHVRTGSRKEGLL